MGSLLCEFFSILLREELNGQYALPLREERTSRRDLIAPALMKIFQEFNTPLTVEELAKLCNISKYHFCHVFKEQMGVSVVRYIIQYRISVAESMLKDEKQSIRRVAALCGFDDVSYFYRCYKQIKGYAPGKTRNS